MQIRRLKLSGFKSFVEPAELHIAPGLTGVVGPNGCGKSNLLEAIRWVMGESSPKSMRGGGMDDVIFAGTATRPQRDFAEVSLSVVQAPGERLSAASVGEDGDLEIVRRIERGAGSAYRANGRDVRAKDVALIFADAATGAHSPALVSQGRIAAVIAARPTERRAMLEEAAGIAGLHVRRKDAEQKLRATEANLARLDDLLTDMETRAQALRRQARAAERYISLSERITLGEARTLFARWRDASHLADLAEKAAQEADGAVRAAQEAQLAAAAHAEAAAHALADARSVAQRARDAAQAIGFTLDQERARLSALIRRREELTRQQAQIGADRAREGQLAQDAASAIATLDDELARITARIKATEADGPALAARLTEAERSARDADVALAEAMARQAGEAAERRVADAAVTSARSVAERAARDLARIEAERAAVPDAAPVEAQLAAQEAIIASAHSDRAEADRALAAAEESGKRASIDRAMAQEALARARSELAALEAESAALTRALGAPSRDRVLDQLTVRPGYERALAAALGDDLDAAVGDAGPIRWSGADRQDGDPALPEGLVPLADMVSAPAALARRLAQIGVADAADGWPLAVGQRVVTRDGRLRRWDGFVADDRGAVAAERLVRRNRLEAIAAERPAIDRAVAQATGALEQASAALSQADQQRSAARAAQGAADEAQRKALRAQDEHRATLARLSQRTADLDGRRAELAAEQARANDALTLAEAARMALPDGAEGAALVQRLSQTSEAARALVAALTAEQGMLTRTIGADRDRQAAVRGDIRSWKARAGDAATRIAQMADREEAIAAELAESADQPESRASAIAALQLEAETLRTAADAALSTEHAAETMLRETERALAAANEALASAREARAGAVARAENAVIRRTEITRAAGERFDCPAPVLPEKCAFAVEDVAGAEAEQARLDALTAERERIGPVNLVAATELAELEETQAKSRADAAELQQAVNQLRGSIGSLNREGRARLLAAFEAVNAHFHRLFTTLFNGGQAHLALIESDDPLEAGLEIMAQPPGKKLTTLTLLSGGEQALTAIALIFGLFLTNPAPICVLDEVDAPLDDANVERFCDLLDRMVADTATRYLIVTHNAVTMSRMHRLFGVTMVEQGVSRLVSVDLSGAERLLAAE